MNQRIACLSIDMEPDLRCPEQRIRLLDDDSRMDELTRLLDNAGVPVTVFTVMANAARYLDRLNALARNATVEFAVHSYSHDTKNPASTEEVRRATATFGELWNRAPFGYRTPNCLIDEAGIDTLTEAGYRYDSSIVPSVRFDAYSYNNLRYSRMPFRFTGPHGSIIELPIACLAGVRLPLVFSYVKLFGLPVYRAAESVFHLPDVVITYLHPYDLYVGEIARFIPGWKRYAHLRNSRSATALLAAFIETLKRRGYLFMTMNDLATRLAEDELPAERLADVA